MSSIGLKQSEFTMPAFLNLKDTSYPGKANKREFSKMKDMKERLKYLDWNDGIIANECAGLKSTGFAFIKQKREGTGVDRKRKDNSVAGINYCLKHDIVFEVVPKCGHTRSEFHIYKLLSSAGKNKRDCPYCAGDSHKYMIVNSTTPEKLPIIPRLFYTPEKQKSKGKSRFKGVLFLGNHKNMQIPEGTRRRKEIRKLWRAEITIDKCSKSIGIYYSEIGAARAYNKEAKKLGRPLNLIK